MRICVVSLFTEEIEEESRLSTLNKKKYCEKYGIDYRFYFGRASSRHAQWDKIQCLIQTLPEYDYVIWMDSDTVFNNFEISLNKLILDNVDFDALFCSDVCYAEGVTHLMVNTGVMIFKNTEWSSNLLNKVWNSIPDYNLDVLKKHSYDGFPHEQGKMCEILLRENDKKFKIFPSSQFNTHPNSSNEKTFIIHYMGSRQSESHLEKFISSVKKINNKLSIDETEIVKTIELKKLKICIVSQFTDNIANVADITIPNKEEYAKKHNYYFKYHKGRIGNRHPGWDKILFLKEVLESNKYDYDVLLIGAGAYAPVWADYAKQQGKIGITICGALQLLFGIKGPRWVDYPCYFPWKKMFNDNWIFPLHDDMPKNNNIMTNIENSYWR